MTGFLFNIDGGYLEGLCRGFKCGVLKQSDYLNLVQCETLEEPEENVRIGNIHNRNFNITFADLKLHLQGTDYGQFLANEPSPLSVSVIDDKLREKLVIEFQHMRNHAVEPLSTFLDFITYSYMIDNIILLITGTLHQRPISELIPKCHPLGSFEQMEAIHVAANPAELYNAVFVDTPLAPFFVDCISEQDLDEMNIEIIRNTLYKAYLEAFYEFCKGLGGTTADVMCEILAYSYKPSNPSTSVKASVQDARTSFKNTRETSRVLRGKKIDDAIKYLTNVIDHKQCVQMRRYARGCGRTHQAQEFKTTRGRWPEKSCNLFIYLLNNLKANADLKRIDTESLVITHVQVNKAPKIYGRLYRAHGRVNSYNSSPCHVEIVAEKEVVQIEDTDQRVVEEAQ